MIIRLNIERYFRLLERESDPAKRHQIVTLLQQALADEASGLSLQKEDMQPRLQSIPHTVFQPPVLRSETKIPSKAV